MSTCKELIEKYSAEEIKKFSLETMPNKEIIQNPDFIKSINRMIKLVSEDTNICLYIEEYTNIKSEIRYEVFGKICKKNDIFIEKYTWEEIMNMNICNDTIKAYGELKAISIILYYILKDALTEQEMSLRNKMYIEDCNIINEIICKIDDYFDNIIIEERQGKFCIWNAWKVYDSIIKGENILNHRVEFDPRIEYIDIPIGIQEATLIVLHELANLTFKSIDASICGKIIKIKPLNINRVV